MTLEEYAQLAQIIGVILVIASLIYVAKELRQNTEAIYAQSRHAILAAAQLEIFAEMDNPDLVISITKADALTQVEQVRLACWLFALFRAREFAWLQYRHGVIDETQWTTEVSVMHFFLDSHRTRDWWARIGRRAFGAEYAEFVDSIIGAQSATETTWQTVAGWADPLPQVNL